MIMFKFILFFLRYEFVIFFGCYNKYCKNYNFGWINRFVIDVSEENCCGGKYL